jgi:uncharacterized protein (TIRG00374 family)
VVVGNGRGMGARLIDRARGIGVGRLLRVGIGIALFVGAVVYLDPRRILASAENSLLVAALAMQPLIVTGWLFAGWRHVVLVGRPHPPVRLGVTAYVVGVGVNMLVPLRAGEIVKATYLREHFGTPVAAGLGAVVISRVLDAAVVGTIGLIGLYALLDVGSLRPILITLASGLAAAAVFACLPRARLRLLARRLPRLASAVLRFVERLARVMRSPLLAGAALISLCGWGANFAAAVVFLSIQTVLGPLSLAEMAALYAVTLFAGAIPGLPGGIGAYQAAGAFVLVQRGYPLEASIALLLVMQAAVLGGTVLFASAALLNRRTGVAAMVSRLRESVRSGR